MRQNSKGYMLGALVVAAILSARSPAPPRRPYIETFDQGPGGWYADRHYALPVWDGVAYCYGPWWLDANHAPPGAGYLHMLMWTYTQKRRYSGNDDYTRRLPYRGSRFAEEGHSTDLRNATLTVRLRGDVDLKGAQMVVLVQAETRKTTANFVLTGHPFHITREWSQQSVVLAPDPRQWTCLGSRHDMTGEYGCDDIGQVLSDVNFDLIFALFPVRSVPACKGVAGVDKLRAVQDYPVLQEALPKGLVMFDLVRIDYPR